MTIRDIWLLGKILLFLYNGHEKYTVCPIREIYMPKIHAQYLFIQHNTIFSWKTAVFSEQSRVEKYNGSHMTPTPKREITNNSASGLSGNGIHYQSNLYKIKIQSNTFYFQLCSLNDFSKILKIFSKFINRPQTNIFLCFHFLFYWNIEKNQNKS